jgi:hypothetical protein
VAATFRGADGSLDWNGVLSSGEVKRRARSFLDVERRTAAIDTLDNVPEADRDTEWHLIKARALTESRRGLDALSVLSALNPQDPAFQSGMAPFSQTVAQDFSVDAAKAARSRQGTRINQKLVASVTGGNQ